MASFFRPLVSLWAEAAGTPAAPSPGAIPYFWARFGNDFFGFLDKNQDDFRTTQTVFGVRATDRVLVTVDFSAFTDRGPSLSQPDPSLEGRIDQATFSLSHRWSIPRKDEKELMELALGVAFRRTGNLNGAAIQNGLHEVINDKPVFLPYEDISRHDVGPLVSFNYFSFLSKEHTWGFWSPIQALMTTAEQAELSAGVYGSYHRRSFKFWSGLRGEARSAGEAGRVIDNAFDQEEGGYYVVGLQAGPLVLDFGHKLGTDYGYGWLTLTQEYAPKYTVDENDHNVLLSVGAEVPYFGLRTDLSWLVPTRWSKPHWRWGITSVFTGGELPEDGPEGWDEYQRGLTAGPVVYYVPEWNILPGASFVANLRYGKRREGFLQTQGAAADLVSVQDVIAADVALVIALSGEPQRGLGLKLGLTGWQPIEGSEQILLGNQSVTVMERQIVPFVSFDYGFGL